MSAYARWLKKEDARLAAEAKARAAYHLTDDAKEAAAELSMERAGLNALTYDPEAYDEMVRDDMNGCT